MRGKLTIVIFGVWAVLACVPGRMVRAAEGPPATAPAEDRKTAIITLEGEIDEYNRDQLFQRFDNARAMGAKVIILNIDTYGGLVTAGLEISRYIKRQDDLHVVAFVKDKAISAGAMIAMACDEIVVSSSSSLGDCAPIIFGPNGLEGMPAAERAKAESPVLLDFDESAHRNHHDPLLAAAMVDVTRVVYWVQDDAGNRKFVDQKEYDQLTATKKWISVPGEKTPIDGPDTLLVVDSDQAIRYGLATGNASSAQSLANRRGYQVVADFTPNMGEKLVEFLSGAVVRGILIIIFLQCLWVVLHAPGHGVAEIVGLAALGLMLGVPLLTGYAQWWEILLIFVGLGLVAVEILLPGHFFPGITGGILLFFGLVMTFVPSQPGGLPNILPHPQLLWAAMQRGIIVVLGAMSVSIFLWFWLSRFLPKVPFLNKIILTETSGGPVRGAIPSAPATASSAWPPLGAIGRALSELRPGGSAEFFDPATADTRITSVISESGYISPGIEIVVRKVDGPSVIVRKRA